MTLRLSATIRKERGQALGLERLSEIIATFTLLIARSAAGVRSCSTRQSASRIEDRSGNVLHSTGGTKYAVTLQATVTLEHRGMARENDESRIPT